MKRLILVLGLGWGVTLKLYVRYVYEKGLCCKFNAWIEIYDI